ncbi:MAG: tRNA glutamyl-Q(34) synthetase GluQRS [Beijerinckiaceae bacterium]|nr:tRNA glutamyl-Q(34) synthetase GluQRS [Beijerinckiaceae bacterium]
MTDPVSTTPVFRFAPSPNGYLHLGHAYSALFNARTARETGGRLLLRIEDIDPGRSRPEFEQAIYEDLAWLGLEWEQPVRRQSEHLSDYELALERLSAQGLVYPCFCTRGDIAAAVDKLTVDMGSWPRDPDGSPFYPGTCKRLSDQDKDRRIASGQHAALRLDMQAALARAQDKIGWCEFFEGDEARDVNAEPSLWGDAVIGRKDVPTSYHLAVVVDDASQGVTDVARGMDLFNATSLHRLLQTLLDLPAPRYRHHRLIEDDEGRKLAKSEGSRTLRSLRAEGVSAQDVRRRLGFD